MTFVNGQRRRTISTYICWQTDGRTKHGLSDRGMFLSLMSGFLFYHWLTSAHYIKERHAVRLPNACRHFTVYLWVIGERHVEPWRVGSQWLIPQDGDRVCVRTRVSRSVSVISTYRARSLLRLVSVLLAIFYFLPCCLFTLQLPTINQYRCVQPCCLFYKKKYVLSQAWCWVVCPLCAQHGLLNDSLLAEILCFSDFIEKVSKESSLNGPCLWLFIYLFWIVSAYCWLFAGPRTGIPRIFK